jgi:hypothetical protein
MPVNRCEWYDLLETLQLAYDECAMSPWASIRDIEVVAVGLRRELSTRLVLNERAEG